MGIIAGGLVLLAALVTASPAIPAGFEKPSGPPQQQVLQNHLTQPHSANSRKLKGRFLHVTDLHPDPFYKPGKDPYGDHPCHSGHGHRDSIADHYGAPTTACDSPFTLVNATFRWIEENIKDEIDFVVWTGDSARHDNDDDIPRDHAQVEGLNRRMVDKFVEVFGRPGDPSGPNPTDAFIIPIIPSFGNNDILPHNIFFPGPNDWTRNYIDIWKKFIPQSEKHTFARGGWFWTEVIPNRLAVISLNTLYFFDRNAAVDGCDLKSEPGYEQMEWLRIQLQFMRERGMKAILIGHVPPARTESKQNWDESCYQKYVLWMRQYRDVVTASLYGHMNVDHFMFQDVKHLKYDFPIDGIDMEDVEFAGYNATLTKNVKEQDDELHTLKKETYLSELRIDWSELPVPPKDYSYNDVIHPAKSKKKEKERQDFLRKIGGPYGERYSISIVSPSVVPNYFPSLRVIEYNITGIEHEHPASGEPRGYHVTEDDLQQSRPEPMYCATESNRARGEGYDETNEETFHKVSKPKKPRPNFNVPTPPSNSSLPGPAHSPQTLSLTSWTQLFANLTRIHERINADREASKFDPGLVLDEYRHFEFETEYTTNKDHVYKISDLTIRRWLDLAERIGRTVYEKSSIDAKPSMQDLAPKTIDEGDTVAMTGQLEDEEENYSESGDVGSMKKKKKHKKSRGKLKDNKLWHEFVRRAYVHSKKDDELQDDFG